MNETKKSKFIQLLQKISWKNTLIFLAGTLLTIFMTFIIERFLTKESLKIKLSHLYFESYPAKHLYLIEIENNGNSTCEDCILQVREKGKVISSTFNNNITTHISTSNQISKLNLEGQYQVNDPSDNSKQEINKKISQKLILKTEDSEIHADNEIYELINNGDLSWYEVSYGKFNIFPKQLLAASIYTEFELTEKDILVQSNSNNYYAKKISSLNKEEYDLITKTITIASGIPNNRIFAEGFGFANAETEALSKIKSRQIALRNLYKEIAKKLYGFSIQGVDDMYLQSTNEDNQESTFYRYEFATRITTSGMIDNTLLTIFDENFYKTDNKTICILKAYYNLPFEIDVSVPELDKASISKNIYTPTKIGEKPEWLTVLPNNDTYFFGVGICPPQLHKFIARQIAINHALEEIASQIEVSISMIITEYNNEHSTKFESLNREIMNHFLKNAIPLEFYEDENNEVYVLVALPVKEFINSYKNYSQIMTKENKPLNEFEYEQFKKTFDAEMEKMAKERGK